MRRPRHFWRRIAIIAACALARDRRELDRCSRKRSSISASCTPSPWRRCWPGPLVRRPRAALVDRCRRRRGGLVWSHPMFDARPLSWIGFVTTKPATEDYVPLAPWAGRRCSGIAVGHRLARNGFRAIAPLGRRARVAPLARAAQPGRLHGPSAAPARRAVARRRGIDVSVAPPPEPRCAPAVDGSTPSPR